jgi:hypothetical protein
MKLSLLIIAVLGFLVIMDLEELGAMAKKKDKCGPKKKGGMAKRGGKGKVSCLHTCLHHLAVPFKGTQHSFHLPEIIYLSN